jgi:hypothetical protein
MKIPDLRQHNFLSLETYVPLRYDAVITLLTDLQALAERDGRRHTFTQRSMALRQHTHANQASSNASTGQAF